MPHLAALNRSRQWFPTDVAVITVTRRAWWRIWPSTDYIREFAGAIK